MKLTFKKPQTKEPIKKETDFSKLVKEFEFKEGEGIYQLWFESLVEKIENASNDELMEMFILAEEEITRKLCGLCLIQKLEKLKFVNGTQKEYLKPRT